MSNHTPPRACLADFGFMTMVLDPVYPLSCSAQLEGGTLMFMSPELLMPTVFDMKDGVPTPEADIYAFGLVIFQVCKLDWRIGGFFNTLSRSLRASSRSVAFDKRSFHML